MDESALQSRLDRIELRQRLVLALLVVPYLFGAAELVGVWLAGALGAAVAVVALAALVVKSRRKNPTAE